VELNRISPRVIGRLYQLEQKGKKIIGSIILIGKVVRIRACLMFGKGKCEAIYVFIASNFLGVESSK